MVTFNGSSLTVVYSFRNRSLEQLSRSILSFRQNLESAEVVVVDYGSSSHFSRRLKDMASRMSFKLVSVASHGQPWSRARALNAGLELVSSDYVLFADIDAEFLPGFIEKCEYQVSEDRALVLGFMWGRRFHPLFPPRADTQAALGQVLVHTQAAKAVQGYPRNYFLWGSEDHHFIARLEKHGTHVSYVPGLIFHRWHRKDRYGGLRARPPIFDLFRWSDLVRDFSSSEAVPNPNVPLGGSYLVDENNRYEVPRVCLLANNSVTRAKALADLAEAGGYICVTQPSPRHPLGSQLRKFIAFTFARAASFLLSSSGGEKVQVIERWEADLAAYCFIPGSPVDELFIDPEDGAYYMRLNAAAQEAA